MSVYVAMNSMCTDCAMYTVIDDVNLILMDQ